LILKKHQFFPFLHEMIGQHQTDAITTHAQKIDLKKLPSLYPVPPIKKLRRWVANYLERVKRD